MHFKRALIVGAMTVVLTSSFALARSGPAFASASPFGVATTLLGHAGPVSSVGFSPNGRTLAAATEDGTVQLWDMRRDRLAGTLTGLVHIVDSVAFSPNGRTVAAGSRGGVIRLWDAPSRRQLGRALRAHSGSIYSVTFSPNGRILAAASADGTVQLWDVNSRSLIGQVDNHAGAIASLAFSPNGRSLAAGDIKGTVVLWDVQHRRRLGVPLRTHHLVSSVAYAPDGRTLAVGNGDQGTVGLWDVHGPAPRPDPAHRQQRPRLQCRVRPPHRDARNGERVGAVQLWGLPADNQLATLNGGTGPVFSVAISPDGRTLAAGGLNGTIGVWRSVVPSA